MEGLVIRKSKINGNGVFAERDFKKDEVVIKWDTSDTFTKDEVEKMSEIERKYITCYNGIYVMMKSPGRFVNHSCDPTVYLKDFSYFAKKSIKKGEEITTNYEDEMIPGQEMECKCGSEKCRGKIICPNY